MHICEIVPQLCVCVCVWVHVFYNASDYSTTIFFFQDSIAVLGHAMLSRSVVSDSLRLHHVPLCMGILQARILEWVACPPPMDLPNQGIEPWSPAFQADTLPLEPLRGPWILEWVAYPFSRGSFWPRSRTEVPCIVGEFFTSWATRETPGTPLWALISAHILRYFYCVIICDQTLSVVFLE